MKSSTEMSCKYNEGSHLKPPTKSTRKARGGPAETGHLTPRSRTTSNTSCISTPGLASSPSSSSAAAVGLASSPSPTILERSRSSGRLVVPCAAEASSGSSLKRGSAASTSALASCSSAATTPSAGGGATSASVGHLLPPPPQRNGGTINTINKCSANVSGGSVIPSSGQQQVTNPKKTKRILLQWKHKASMSKLGKGTRSLVRMSNLFFSKLFKRSWIFSLANGKAIRKALMVPVFNNTIKKPVRQALIQTALILV